MLRLRGSACRRRHGGNTNDCDPEGIPASRISSFGRAEPPADVASPTGSSRPAAAGYEGQVLGCSAKFIAHDWTSAVKSGSLATSNPEILVPPLPSEISTRIAVQLSR